MTNWPALPGHFSIAVAQNGDPADPDSCRIDVFDERSTLLAMRIELSFLTLVEALRGRGRCACTFQTNDSPDVGRTLEVRTEIVVLPEAVAERSFRLQEDPEAEPARARVREALAAAGYAEDGWQGSPDDVFNHHRHVSPAEIARLGIVVPDDHRAYRITFRRWVDAAQGRATV